MGKEEGWLTPVEEGVQRGSDRRRGAPRLPGHGLPFGAAAAAGQLRALDGARGCECSVPGSAQTRALPTQAAAPAGSVTTPGKALRSPRQGQRNRAGSAPSHQQPPRGKHRCAAAGPSAAPHLPMAGQRLRRVGTRPGSRRRRAARSRRPGCPRRPGRPRPPSKTFRGPAGLGAEMLPGAGCTAPRCSSPASCSRAGQPGDCSPARPAPQLPRPGPGAPPPALPHPALPRGLPRLPRPRGARGPARGVIHGG